MKTALHTGALKLEIVRKPVPEVTDPDHALLKVGAVGFCGSDKHDLETPPRVRQTPGHEFSGLIKKLGSEPSGFRVGDRVLVRPQAYCGECDLCRERPRRGCQKGGVYGCRGSQHPPGAMAEYVLVRTDNLTKIPDGLSLDAAAMTDPLSVAIHAVDLGPKVEGESCVIMGAGVIGLLLAQVLRRMGAGRVALVDVARSHLEVAARLADFETYMANDREALVPKLEALGSGIYYELAGGDSPTLDIAIGCIRREGTILLVSQRPKGVWLNYQSVMGKQLALRGVAGNSDGSWRQAAEMIFRREIEVEPLITHRYPLEQAAEALRTALQADSLKVMLKPNPEVS